MSSESTPFPWLDLALKGGEVGAWYWDLEDPLRRIERTEVYDRIFGLKAEQVWTRDDLYNHIHPADREKIAAKFESVTQGNALEYRAEYRIIRDNGESRSVKAWGQGIRNPAGKMVRIAGIIRDITEDKKIRKDRDQFVATLSHDLRNPLAAARVNAEMIKRYPIEQHAKASDKIILAIERADRIIQDLLDLSRTQTGQLMHLVLRDCDLRQTLLDSVNDLSLQYGSRFLFEAMGDFKGTWAEDALRRVLENLVINAVKYGGADKPIRIYLERKDNAVSLAVRNEDNPIPPEEQQSLFELFNRGKSAELSDSIGWGLGLSIVQAVAEALHGRVALESSPALGTTFSIQFPLSNALTE